MRLSLYTYNAHAINDGTNYEAYFADDRVMRQQDVSIVEVPRPDNVPAYAGQVIPGGNIFAIAVKMLGTISSQIDELKTWFNTYDKNQYKLIAKDLANSNKQWYVYAKPKGQPKVNGQEVIFELSVSDPVWYEETESSDTWAITASGQTKEITVGGNLPARPRFVITPTDVGVAGYAYKFPVIIYNPIAYAFPNYPIDIVKAALDTATLIGASKMQADGDDLRVFVDGVEVNRWIDGINTAATKVWCNIDFAAKVELTLGLAIADPHTSLTTIAYANTYYNNIYVQRLPQSGKLLIGTEEFSYSGINQTTKQFTGVVPTINGTSSAAHSLNDTIRWVQHDIWVMYGNDSVPDPADGVDDYDDRKPVIDLANSTNTSWVYAEFWDTKNLRTGAWKPANLGIGQDPINGLNYYTGSETALADPATEMGLSAYAWQVGNYWRVALINVEWRLYHPAGISTVTVSGQKYRYTTNWPFAYFQKSTNGLAWISVWTEATPASVQTWTALSSHSAVSLGAGNWQYLRFWLYGYLGATANNCAHHEATDVTVVPISTNVPQITVGAEQNNYHIQATITNQTTGEYITINYGMALNESITIDCENKTVVHSSGVNAISALGYSTMRGDWLNLLAGVNTLKFDDTGTSEVTFVTYWRDRNS